MTVRGKMSDEHRAIIARYWVPLRNWINPNEALMESLVSEKVIPVSMADDIRAGDNQKSKNERLLNSLKILGMSSFRKFRHVLLEHGYTFLVELLWDDVNETACYIEECDFEGYPSFNTSLNPLERKQLIWLLDSKIKSRLIKADWKNNAEERMKKIKSKIENDNKNCDEYRKMITRLKADLNSKNETLKSMVRDYNTLNDDMTSFEKRHQLNTCTLIEKSHERGDSADIMRDLEIIYSSANANSRFAFIDKLVTEMDQRLSALLGGEVKPFVSIEDLNEKTKQLKQLVREIEATLDKQKTEQNRVKELLFPFDPACQDGNLLQTVQNFLSKEQHMKFSFLTDIDQLSRKLRRIKEEDSNSGLRGLMQSAVTGNPNVEMIDFRFVRNHIALLFADVEHVAKKIAWKEEELDSLNDELQTLKNKQKKVSLGPLLLSRRHP